MVDICDDVVDENHGDKDDCQDRKVTNHHGSLFGGEENSARMSSIFVASYEARKLHAINTCPQRK
jgi:hypothetical protein